LRLPIQPDRVESGKRIFFSFILGNMEKTGERGGRGGLQSSGERKNALTADLPNNPSGPLGRRKDENREK
jgi:hypothetical protein